MQTYDLAIIGTGSGNSILDERYRRQAGGDLRAGHVRRYLPERRVHPDQDVRLRRRGRQDDPGARRATASTRTSTGCAGTTSSRASSDGSIRSRSAARTIGAPRPISTCTTSTPASGPVQADGRYLLRTDGGDEFIADQVVIAAGARPMVPPGDPRVRRPVLHQRHHHADRRVARASGDRRRWFRGSRIRTHLLRAGRRGSPWWSGARPCCGIATTPSANGSPASRRANGNCTPTATWWAPRTTARASRCSSTTAARCTPTCCWSRPAESPTPIYWTPSRPASTSRTAGWWSTNTNEPPRVGFSRSATSRRRISSSTSPTTRRAWCSTICCATGTTPRRWPSPITATSRRRYSPIPRSPASD